jgi:hypothetical protein
LYSRQKNLGKRVPKFKTRDKKGNLEGKRDVGDGMRINPE